MRYKRDAVPLDEKRGTTVTWILPPHVSGDALRATFEQPQLLLGHVAGGLQFSAIRGQIHATHDDGQSAYQEVAALLAPLGV
ncbi:hypothetical protein [Deinococcus pimensis]|uniref:hypothetical protein n=1 Tax=Deinococcus pimensis TaxID=309888 RepID=UPI000480CA34|nr:hypothetical protein [Deinococcus pimensis]